MNKEYTGERLETFVYNESTIEHLHRYAIAREFVTNKVVLDIACGEGYGSNLLAASAEKVIGVDISKDVIRKAKNKYKKSNLSFLEGSVEHIPCSSESIDVIVSFETIEHITEHHKMMEECKRVLKPNGTLIISTPDKKHYSDLENFQNPFHLKELYRDEFKSLILQFFKHAVFLRQNSIVSSLISSDTAPGKLNYYKGDFETIETVQTLPPLYFISIASDKPVEVVPDSIFLSDKTLDIALKQRLQNSIAYRTGNIILWPLKKAYAFFKKRV